MTADRDHLAALVASRRGVTAKVNDTDREVAARIIAAGWLPAPPVCKPYDHVFYQSCGLCGEIPEEVDYDRP